MPSARADLFGARERATPRADDAGTLMLMPVRQRREKGYDDRRTRAAWAWAAWARAARAQVFEFDGDHSAVALQAEEFTRVTLDAIAAVSRRTAATPST